MVGGFPELVERTRNGGKIMEERFSKVFVIFLLLSLGSQREEEEDEITFPHMILKVEMEEREKGR